MHPHVQGRVRGDARPPRRRHARSSRRRPGTSASSCSTSTSRAGSTRASGALDEDLPYHAPCQLRSHGIGLPALDLFALVPGPRGRRHGPRLLRDRGHVRPQEGEVRHRDGGRRAAVREDPGDRAPTTAACDSETCRWQIETATGVAPATRSRSCSRRIAPATRRARLTPPSTGSTPRDEPAGVRCPIVVVGARRGRLVPRRDAARRRGADVTLLGRRPVAGATDPATSLELHEPTRTTRTVSAVARRDATRRTSPPPDLVVVAVKAFDLEGALETARRWPGRGDPDRPERRRAPRRVADAGSPTPPRCSPPRSRPPSSPPTDGVQRLRTGGIGVAVVRDDEAGAARALARGSPPPGPRRGLPAGPVRDADAMKWSKLLANLVGNATSAILDMDPGGDLRRPRPTDRAAPAARGARGDARARAPARRPARRRTSRCCSAASGCRRRSDGRSWPRDRRARAAASRRRCGSTSAAAAPAPPRSAGSTARSPRRGRGPGVPTPVNEALAAHRRRGRDRPGARRPLRRPARPARRGDRAPGRRRPVAPGHRPILGPRGPLRARSRAPDRRRAYLIGGIPWSVIVARLTGRHRPAHDRQRPDRRRERHARPRAAAGAAVGDPRPAQGHRRRAAGPRRSAPAPGVEVLAGMAAIIGHSRSPFLGFGGGRGVAPAFGGLFAFAPLVALIIIPLFVDHDRGHPLLVAGLARRRRRAAASCSRSRRRRPGSDPWLYVYAVGGDGARLAVPRGQHPAPARGHGTPDRHARATRADVRRALGATPRSGRPAYALGVRGPRPVPDAMNCVEGVDGRVLVRPSAVTPHPVALRDPAAHARR